LVCLFVNLKCSSPVVGILANTVPDDVHDPIRTKVYASYVRWFEAAGATAIVIQPWTTKEQLEEIFTKVNGFFFQGGGRTFDLNAPWEKLAKQILTKVVQSNLRGEYIPLWGTCLGFELIQTLIAGTRDVLVPVEGTYNIATPLVLDEQTVKGARMFKYFSDNDIKSLKTENTTAQYHHFGISKKSFENFANNVRYFNITSYGRGSDDVLAVATYEAKHMPIYATQFHPEKFPYDRKESNNLPQFGNAIKISQNLALFFVDELRKNKNVFAEEDKSKYQYIDTYKQKATLVDGVYYYFYDM